ncbi:MAG: ATP-dependent Clp protease proteolytic subunit [Bacilli bacterium]|nr:ATP-dependent Clp protease proteolytic subunit [Clostridia bacterium]MBR4618419.1 ATP-dependent Clp protease proteolytic subunit [Bacilli bacterium]
MLNIPHVIWKDENGNERAVDITTRLLKDRIVMCTGEVNDELAESIVSQLLYLEAEDPDKPVNMMVMGPGGSVTAGFSIISTMNTIKCPVYTTVMGEVASMSAMIAVSGKKGHRKVYPNSEIMLHTVSAGAKGKIQDMTITLAQVEKTNERCMKHLAECCGKDLETIKKDCDRDFWMDENEAIAYGALDEIAQPR